MKKLNPRNIIYFVVKCSFVSLLLMVMSCNKTIPPESELSEVDIESEVTSERFMAFKEKMEYHYLNPHLKGSELFTSDSAVLEMEGLINLMFCYAGDKDTKIGRSMSQTSTIIISLDELLKISASDLAQVYIEEVIDSLKSHITYTNYTDYRLMIVDIELENINNDGNAEISLTSIVGEFIQVMPEEEVGWWYGFYVGACNGEEVGNDAASVLMGELTYELIPDPPAGKEWKWAPPIIKIGPINPLAHPNPNGEIDNLMDYKIFYAVGIPEDNLYITDLEKCVGYTPDNEMNFYLNQYTDFIEDSENNLGLHFSHSFIEGIDGLAEDPPYILHRFEYFLGSRYWVWTSQPMDIFDYEVQ